MNASTLIRHICGCTRRHEYESMVVAELDQRRQERKKCPECREKPRSDADRAKVAEMARVRRAKKETE